MQEDIDNQSDTATLTEAPDQLSTVAAERDQLAREKAELQDLLLRRQAEFENFRRRSERERMEFAEYAGMETIRQLLPVVDDFERALKAARVSEETGSEFVRGVEMIYNRLLEIFRKAGLEPVAAIGRKFDPHVHDAIKMVQHDELEDHTVVEEYERGYNFKGRLLRPAKVVVAVKP